MYICRQWFKMGWLFYQLLRFILALWCLCLSLTSMFGIECLVRKRLTSLNISIKLMMSLGLCYWFKHLLDIPIKRTGAVRHITIILGFLLWHLLFLLSLLLYKIRNSSFKEKKELKSHWLILNQRYKQVKAKLKQQI